MKQDLEVDGSFGINYDKSKSYQQGKKTLSTKLKKLVTAQYKTDQSALVNIPVIKVKKKCTYAPMGYMVSAIKNGACNSCVNSHSERGKENEK